MHQHLAQTSAAGAIALLALLATVLAGLTLGLRCRPWRWALIAGAVGGGVFQLGHFAEHVAQVGYWALHTDKAPWMTPWASALADSFGRLAPGTSGFGMEALHLVGNAIFLAGAVAILTWVVRNGPVSSHRPARAGVAVQSVHVVEHVALTVSVIVGSRPRGLSTLFGTLDPGPGLWTYRVWWHLTVNAVATTLLAVALARAHRRHTARAARPSPALAG
jgi:hypothetical protein